MASNKLLFKDISSIFALSILAESMMLNKVSLEIEKYGISILLMNV
jgi:hypothetical protein